MFIYLYFSLKVMFTVHGYSDLIYPLTCFDVFNLYSPSFDLFDVLDVIYNLYFNPVCLCLNSVITEHPQQVTLDFASEATIILFKR